MIYSTVLAACCTDGHRFEPWTSANACRPVCRYVDQKGSAPMLTSVQSAGVTPEMNLRNLLCTSEEARKGEIHPGSKTQGRRLQKSKTGASVAPKNLLKINFQNMKILNKSRDCSRTNLWPVLVIKRWDVKGGRRLIQTDTKWSVK